MGAMLESGGAQQNQITYAAAPALVLLSAFSQERM